MTDEQRDSEPSADEIEEAPVVGMEPPIDKSGVGHVLTAIDENFDEGRFKEEMQQHLSALASKYGVDQYLIIYLVDPEDSLSSWHSDRIYQAASLGRNCKDILLVVDSRGGSIEAGYFIGKTGKRLARTKFAVSVPRKAKSAATLLALGADEIHMGLLSELGPIDPQIQGYPAQGIKNSLEILSEMSCRHPGAAGMLGEYLTNKLDLRILGLFERINESAIQYAERLLANKSLPSPRTPQSLADHLVNHYKDHGFVIDYDEAADLLGHDMVKQDSPEYGFANAVYESIELIRFVLRIRANRSLDLVGSIKDGIRVFQVRGPN